MHSRKKIAIKAELNNCSGDLSKRWFVFFSVTNPASPGKLKRLKDYGKTYQLGDYSFSNFVTAAERSTYAMTIIEKINMRLESGWNPLIDDGKTIYESSIAYHGEPKQVKADFSLSYHLDAATGLRIKSLRDKSQCSYKSKVRKFKEWLLENKLSKIDVKKFTPEHAEKFLNFIEDKRTMTTRNSYLSTIKSLFEDLKKSKVVNANPFEQIKKKKESRQGKLPFRTSQVEALKDYISKSDLQLWVACQLQYYCMIRPGREMYGLRVADVMIEDSKIIIRKEIAKNKRTQYVTIPAALSKVLLESEYLKSPEDFYLFGEGGKPGKKPLSRNYFYRRHRKAQLALSISSKHSFYSWKHTGNVRAAQVLDLKKLQEQNRHHDLNTLDIYLKGIGAYENTVIRDSFPSL